MWPAVRSNHAKLIEQEADRLSRHLAAATGVDDGLTRANVFTLEYRCDEMLGNYGIGAPHEHPADDVAAEDIDHHEHREPDALVRAADIVDVPREQLARRRREQLRFAILGMARQATPFANFSIRATPERRVAPRRSGALHGRCDCRRAHAVIDCRLRRESVERLVPRALQIVRRGSSALISSAASISRSRRLRGS
jgi:hypothetical protein